MIYVSSQYLTAKPHALLFQALANPVRMQILLLLRDKGGLSVSRICEELGLEQTHVSHNLRCLSFCGLVNSSRDGKTRIYSINGTTAVQLLEAADRHIKEYASNLFSCDALER
jgi:DNA-binding transcriptional ArsR family regulator